MKKVLRELYDAHHGKLTDKWVSYLGVYDTVLGPFRDQPVRMLEIGIQNGGSLEIWSQFFEQAEKLIGCDINPKCADLSYDDPRIKVVVGDANAQDIQERVLNHSPIFDIILDDGSHSSSDIVKSFARYFAHLIDGGVYIVEDLHCSYWQSWEGGLYNPYSSMAFFKLLVDVINHEHWGVAKERVELFRDFAALKMVPLTEELLAHVHSLEFTNSLCIVRKKKPETNQLGERLIVGTVEQVTKNHQVNDGKTSTASDETSNPWAQSSLADRLQFERDQIAAEKDQMAAEKDQIAAEKDQIAADRDRILQSHSWLITRPLRLMLTCYRKIRHKVQSG